MTLKGWNIVLHQLHYMLSMKTGNIKHKVPTVSQLDTVPAVYTSFAVNLQLSWGLTLQHSLVRALCMP